MANFLEIFSTFLRLGCTSFGGPVAHLGYFREEFVDRRQWLTDAAYTEIVALSQFVPGPASSQTGFAIGVIRGGLPGGIAAWLGFTLPSALLMLLAAYGLALTDAPGVQGLIHGLKLFAVAIVAQAVWSLGRSLCPDGPRAGFAFVIASLLIIASSEFSQLAAIMAGAVFGLAFLRGASNATVADFRVLVPRTQALAALALFALLLAAVPLAEYAIRDGYSQLVLTFYRAGALVFGGGHVILPLLEESVVEPGFVDRGTFLAGYGAAQALPGPVFTFAAFLGAKASIGPGGAAGAVIALIAVFLPGLLLVYGALAFWDRIRANITARAALAGVNAAVVGILAAALYQPIWTATIIKPVDASIALLAFAALVIARLPVLLVASLTAAAGLGLTIL